MTARLMCLTSALALTAGAAMAEGADTKRESSPKIIDVTADDMTLVYTDSPMGVLGHIDITDAANPTPLGNIALPGEPTSVAVIGGTAYVGVNTSESYSAPSGETMFFSIGKIDDDVVN